MEPAIVSKMSEFGCRDLDRTLERFLGDTEFYEDVLRELAGDAGFERLGDELRGADARAAFDTAHMLKGIIGNCGVTPMYELICRIVEPLRAGKCGGLTQDYDALMEKRAELVKLLG